MRTLLILSAALVPMTVLAQPAPAVFLMPAPVLGAVRQYLGGRPHDEVAGLIGMLEACAALQIPGKESRTGPAECRPVAEALAAQGNGQAPIGRLDVTPRTSGPARSPGE